MARPPRVTILLPVWNGERFLAKALASMLAQTYLSFELLVIDDGSTDGTHEIVQEFASRDPRVVVTRIEHGGIVVALNAGLAGARGELIARMDADDISHPDRLAQQVSFLDTHPECVAAGSDIVLIDEEDEPLGSRRFPRTHADIVNAMLSGGTHAICHPAVMMRRNAVMRAGGYHASLFPSEDLDLWLRLVDYGELRNVDEPLLSHRRHHGAIGVRERIRQSITWHAVVNAARVRHGLHRLAWRLPTHHAHHNATATYHFDCARIALTAGRRPAARRHALACTRHAPSWWRPYAALAVTALPEVAFTFVMKLYASVRARRASTSSAM